MIQPPKARKASRLPELRDAYGAGNRNRGGPHKVTGPYIRDSPRSKPTPFKGERAPRSPGRVLTMVVLTNSLLNPRLHGALVVFPFPPRCLLPKSDFLNSSTTSDSLDFLTPAVTQFASGTPAQFEGYFAGLIFEAIQTGLLEPLNCDALGLDSLENSDNTVRPTTQSQFLHYSIQGHYEALMTNDSFGPLETSLSFEPETSIPLMSFQASSWPTASPKHASQVVLPTKATIVNPRPGSSAAAHSPQDLAHVNVNQELPKKNSCRWAHCQDSFKEEADLSS
ncbi:hypothetical protein BJ875DRAFT_512474 [Amylocarpus encephaloides]|uniref:Uncharacterized protein n=1 Tax=Amylocarpus encephaloides TaxID=45428 RepID=A0A9P7YH02_9HELO|nr:hypothetical protein BJ875DRAFT_512474 [Amylocarpus encephaloides]